MTTVAAFAVGINNAPTMTAAPRASNRFFESLKILGINIIISL
jgi:hypothetical protein